MCPWRADPKMSHIKPMMNVFASGDDNVIYFLVSELESSAMMVIAAAMNTVAFK